MLRSNPRTGGDVLRKERCSALWLWSCRPSTLQRLEEDFVDDDKKEVPPSVLCKLELKSESNETTKMLHTFFLDTEVFEQQGRGERRPLRIVTPITRNNSCKFSKFSIRERGVAKLRKAEKQRERKLSGHDTDRAGVRAVNDEHQVARVHEQLQPFRKDSIISGRGYHLFESRAIMSYVATKFEGQGAPLLGSTFSEQALCNQWLEVNGHSFTPAIIEMAVSKSDTESSKLAFEKFEKVLDVYEARLSVSKYLAGDSYTLADLAHTPLFMALSDDEKKKCLTSRPLHAWNKDISSRPAWKKVTERPENTFYKPRTESQ
ncbi:hypothetical protein R1flu_021955 [Riccia fluitans]|uniref:glutathione transferase n=1 Tax=Riccia fluitans TaxID=41844 RepID=A0ABD1ZS00_9MARC